MPLPVSPSIRIGLLEAATLAGVLGQLRGSAADVPDEGIDRLAGLARPAGDLAPPLALALEEPPEHDQERRQLDRLGQELVGPLLDRAHREVDRGVAGQDHHRQRGVELPEPGQEVEGGAVGEHVVEDHGVGAPLADRLLGGGDGVGLVDLEALALEEVADPEADTGLVVDDQDLGQSCSSRAGAGSIARGGPRV